MEPANKSRWMVENERLSVKGGVLNPALGPGAMLYVTKCDQRGEIMFSVYWTG